MSDKTALGDRMKHYERLAEHGFLPMLPIMARIDGRCFSQRTRGLERPYDSRLSQLMTATAKHLLVESNARCAYVQSDEITLAFLQDNPKSEIFFGGRQFKMCSILASIATGFFNQSDLFNGLPPAQFDCRVWQVPSVTEAANVFVWREQDATRNSIESAARAHYSHKECFKKHCGELQEMLFQKGVNWNDYPDFFKRGTYIRTRVLERPFTPEELESLPPLHHARTDPELVTRRTVVASEHFPPITQIVNREDVLLFGADPVLCTEESRR